MGLMESWVSVQVSAGVSECPHVVGLQEFYDYERL